MPLINFHPSFRGYNKGLSSHTSNASSVAMETAFPQVFEVMLSLQNTHLAGVAQSY